MVQTAPRVTVITANYRYAHEHFEGYLNALFAQAYKPTLVVIADDGSGQQEVDFMHEALRSAGVHVGTRDRYYRYLVKGINFEIIPLNSNRGPSAARNKAIQSSIDQTDVFALYDMDDRYEPDKISASMEVFFKYPHVRLVYSDYMTLDTRSGVRSREYKEPYDYFRLTRECIVSTNPLVSAQAFREAGLYDETLRVAEDWDLWLRIAERGVLYHLPKPLFEYRVTGQGATFTVPKETWNQCWTRVQEKLMERRKAAS